MIERTPWFERQFAGGMGAELLPNIIERLRGTPARLEERLSGLSGERLTRRLDDGWSIQENAGHLLDLEPLWHGRLDDLQNGAEVLRPTDLENRKTHEANHNRQPLDDILVAFRRARALTVERLEALTDRELQARARHPRLDQPMGVADLCFFVAEHDDHHLARISTLLIG